MPTRLEPLPQRQLLHQLIYLVGMAQQTETVFGDGRQTALWVSRLRALIEAHPHAMAGAYIRRNLYPRRVAWLKERKLLDA